MINLNERYIIDAEGKRVGVVLDVDKYEQLLERLEDLEDSAWAQAYEARKAAGQLTPDELEMIPLEQVVAEFEAEQTS